MLMDMLSNIPEGQPFVKTDRLAIYVLTTPDKTKITGFDATVDGKQKIFKVKKDDILGAWKEMEVFTGKFL